MRALATAVSSRGACSCSCRSVACAHAEVVATDPVDGARLPISPASVSVTFNEHVTLAPGGLRVVRPDGTLADTGDEVVAGATVSQAIEPLPDGWYVMAWSIISDDGHVVHGSATFAVGDADAAARPTPSESRLAARDRAVAHARPADLVLLAGAGAPVRVGRAGCTDPARRRLAAGRCCSLAVLGGRRVAADRGHRRGLRLAGHRLCAGPA